ncbi:hypothetical protein ALC152_08630 [Arcobacter sp. 15-2]|uniref:thiamine phosphate synthase n=1 Tax=Arcobacter sp. 15-2 TaxID=3374109 RepID=UPI00399C8748
MKEVTTHTIKKEASSKSPFFISYLITDPDEFGTTPEELKRNLSKALMHFEVDILCFRDKKSIKKKILAQTCLEIGRKYKVPKILINSEIELCTELGFDGIHLNSSQFYLLKDMKKNELFTIISCHTEEDILLAKKYKSDAVTYSPIFFKKDKGKPKGLDNLKDIVSKYQQEDFLVIALGGIIDAENVKSVIQTGAKGFASIRYFKI